MGNVNVVVNVDLYMQARLGDGGMMYGEGGLMNRDGVIMNGDGGIMYA